MPCPTVLSLVEYWSSCPPSHLMLKYIGQVMGLKFDSQPVATLSDLEQKAQSGFIPGHGQVSTASYDSLPITVREMLVELKKGKFNA